MTYRSVIPTLLAAAFVAGCAPAPAPDVADVRPVRTIVAGRTPGSVGATYSGEIRARYESQLGFRTSGKIVKRLVEVGSRVKRGQPLLQLDPSQEELQVAAAGAEVDAVRSQVAQARTDLRRVEQLLAKNFASQSELDHQRLALDQAESQLRAANARRQLNANLRGYTTLVADRDGVVSTISVEAGQVVAAGQPVVTVQADGEREVAVSVPESRVDELRKTPLKVGVWAHPDKAWTGTLRELAPDTDSVTRTYSARISINDPDPALLRLGMTATVFAPDVDGSTAFRLPLTAIVDQADGHRQVWVVDPKTLRVAPRAVSLGSAQNDSVMVRAGLTGGEIVVTAGVHMLQPGQLVKPQPVAAAAVSGGAR